MDDFLKVSIFLTLFLLLAWKIEFPVKEGGVAKLFSTTLILWQFKILVVVRKGCKSV